MPAGWKTVVTVAPDALRQIRTKGSAANTTTVRKKTSVSSKTTLT